MMKTVFTYLLVIFPGLVWSQTTYKGLPVIQAQNKTVDIQVDNDLREGQWGIVPEVSPDVYSEFIKKGESKRITFFTDVDSISFEVKVGDSQAFYIHLKDSVYALTEIQGLELTEAAIFSPTYIASHRGKYLVEVPEVQELLHIVFAISPRGLEDRNMVDHSTGYYQKVLQHFQPYQGEALVKDINQMLTQGYYARLKMNSCAYIFEGDQIKNEGIYNRLSWGNINELEPFIPALEAFAQKSGFRQFYARHQSYYDSLIQATRKYMPIKKQWDWCEKHFDHKYDSYKITFSPLVNGSHSTNHFKSNGFSETVMFICAAYKSDDYNESVYEGLNSRIVFTEIDHNYVNPISDEYLSEINEAFKDYAKWYRRKYNSYSSPYATFNEYMTWAVFCIYAREQFQEADFKIINAITEEMMAKHRGFSQFPAFNAKMLDLYQASDSKQFRDLYPAILAWAKAYQF